MPKNAKKPQIRFKGFTDAWEQRKLGNFGKTYTGLSGKTKDDFGHGKAQFITYMNVYSNPIIDVEMTEPIEIDLKQNEVEIGDVFFTTSSETPEEVGMSSVLLKKCGTVYLNSFCFGFRPFIILDNYFLAYMLRAQVTRKQIILLAQGISRYNISKNKVMEINIFVPHDKEQQQLGKFFYKLDNLITLHQRKLDKLKNIKKSMLEKMFPKNGSNIPEIRFKGFTDAWEQRKLGEFGKATSGTSIEAEFLHEGKYKVINIGSYSEISQYIDQGIRVNKTEKIMNRILNKDDLTMILNDKTSKGNIIGRVLLIDADDTYVYNQRTERIEVYKDLFEPNFIYQLLNAENIRKKIISSAQGNTQIYINWSIISNFNYFVPLTKSEQKHLANFFDYFDNLITLHQRKLEKLQNIKKACLEKMFV